MANEEQKSEVWMDSLIAHLELLETECGHIRKGEFLEPKKLNKVLDLMETSRNKFLLICELHGFKTKVYK